MIGRPKDRVIVASEKADFVADRIAAGLPAPEIEMRKLARYLREIAADMEPKSKAVAPSTAEPRLRGEPSSWRRRAQGAVPPIPDRSVS
jgi:hypothetical protein